MKFLSTPVNIAPAIGDSWQTVDLTSYLGADAGNVKAILVRWSNESTSVRYSGIREPGSTDDFRPGWGNYNYNDRISYINSSNEVEVYRDSSEQFWLEGYWLNSEAPTLRAEADFVNVTPGTFQSWQTVDVSAYVTGPCIGIFYLEIGGGGVFGVRPYGDTAIGTYNCSYGKLVYVPLDASGRCEAYINQVTDFLYFIGSIPNFTAVTPTQISFTTNDTIETVDISGTVPSDAVAIVVHGDTNSTTQDQLLYSPAWSGTYDPEKDGFWNLDRGLDTIIGITGQEVRGFNEDITDDLFITGYLTNGGGPSPIPPTFDGPNIGNQSNTVGDTVNLDVAGRFSPGTGSNPVWSATGLPAGASINQSGVITGMLTTEQAPSVTVTLTTSEGAASSNAFTWTVQAAQPGVTVYTVAADPPPGAEWILKLSHCAIGNDVEVPNQTDQGDDITWYAPFDGTFVIDNATGQKTFTARSRVDSGSAWTAAATFTVN